MVDAVPGIDVQDFPVSTDGFTDADYIPGFRKPSSGRANAAEKLFRKADFAAIAGAAGGGYFLPENYGAVGNAHLGGTVTDDTGAFNLMKAAIAATGIGGRVWLDPSKCYALKGWVVDVNNMTIESDNGFGPANVLRGITAYDDTAAALILGSGTVQLVKFKMRRVRVYSQTRLFGMFVRSCAYGRFDDCEIGGFHNYWLKVSAVGGGSYYLRFNTCSFFGTAGDVGNGIEMDYGDDPATEFTAAVGFNDCDIDGAAPTSSAFRLMNIGDKVDCKISNDTWFTCQDGKGIKILGTGRLMGDGMIDGPSSGLGTLVEIPTVENTANSFVLGDVRINGKVKNSAGTLFDHRGPNQFGRGLFYGPKLFQADLIGPTQLIDTGELVSGALAGRPVIRTSGGPPPGSDAIGSLFVSRNNGGSSNTGFLQTDSGPENIITGGYVDHVGPNTTVNASGVADMTGYKGNWCSLTFGGHSLSSLGQPTTTKRQNIFFEFQDAGTVVHDGTFVSNGGIYIQNWRHNVSLQSGDVALVHSYGGRWRMIMIWTWDGRTL